MRLHAIQLLAVATDSVCYVYTCLFLFALYLHLQFNIFSLFIFQFQLDTWPLNIFLYSLFMLS
jgi:hypothetical protein